MARSRASLIAVAIVATLAGCRSTGRTDLIEAELRTRERENDELRGELMRAEAINGALNGELQVVRAGRPCAPPVDGECSNAMLKSLSLAAGTGGYDEDRCLGDEVLMVVAVPKDEDGTPMKVPGTLYVQALEVSPEGVKTLLSEWEVPPMQLRRTWRAGILATGYFVTLPWKVVPSQTKLRVVARLVLPDGRVFEAERDTTVKISSKVLPQPIIVPMPVVTETAPVPGPMIAPIPVPLPTQSGVPAPSLAPAPVPAPPAVPGTLPLPEPVPAGPALPDKSASAELLKPRPAR